MMGMLNWLRRAFIEESYAIAWRYINTDAPLPLDGYSPSYTLLRSGQLQWWADPFPFEYNGDLYIFVEFFKRSRALGSIAYFKLSEDGKVEEFKEVLIEPFHLSFPNVFLMNGGVYMIPESENANQIRLYRAERFPDVWVLDRVLASGRRFVDTSISFNNVKPDYLFSQDFLTKELLIYRFDAKALELIPCQDNLMMTHERSGGNCLWVDGKEIRVLQDCSKRYGERILFYKIQDRDLLDVGKASDSFISSFSCDDVNVSKKYKFERLHTFNRSDHIEVIDLLEHRVVILKPLQWLIGNAKKQFESVLED